MIQRFNFYDIYGNLIPGLALVALLWIPVAATTHHWPDSKLGSVLAILAVGYVVGHVLQSLAQNVFPTKTYVDVEGTPCYPSTALLNVSDKRFDASLKQRIQSNVQSWFGISVSVDSDSDGVIASRRQAAFFLCRPIVNARMPYAEQFQGLYSMMRGLTSALAVFAAYLVGWLASFFSDASALGIGEVVLMITLLIVAAISVPRINPNSSKNRKDQDLAISLFICAGVCAVGCVMPRLLNVQPAPEWKFYFLCALASTAIVALRCYSLYRYFAVEFAAAVWHYFAVEPTQRPSSEPDIKSQRSDAEGESSSDV